MFLPLKCYWNAVLFCNPPLSKTQIAKPQITTIHKKPWFIFVSLAALLSTSISVGFSKDLCVCVLNTNINTQPNSCENIHDTFLWNVRGREENIGAVMEMLCTHHLQIAMDNLQCCHTREKRLSIAMTFLPMLSFSRSAMLKVKRSPSLKLNLLVVITFPMTFC